MTVSYSNVFKDEFMIIRHTMTYVTNMPHYTTVTCFVCAANMHNVLRNEFMSVYSNPFATIMHYGGMSEYMYLN